MNVPVELGHLAAGTSSDDAGESFTGQWLTRAAPAEQGRSSFAALKVVAVPAQHQAMVGAPPNVLASLRSSDPRRGALEEILEGDSDDFLRCDWHRVDAYLSPITAFSRGGLERDLHHVAPAGVSPLADSGSQEVDHVQCRDAGP